MHLTDERKFESEAALVAAWLSELRRFKHDAKWTIYPETAGWDLLMVHEAGFQLGIEAKLSLNAKVLAQTLDGAHRYYRDEGPDYRGVLVPRAKCQLHMGELARALGVGVIAFAPASAFVSYQGCSLPGERSYDPEWPNWLPGERCKVPDYVPDVAAGVASPVQLTEWKVKAIKLCIVLERRGYVTRRDMKALQISPTRWCDHWHGFLDREPHGYVRGRRTPDLRAQHPTNYAEIEADAAVWGKDLDMTPDAAPPSLL